MMADKVVTAHSGKQREGQGAIQPGIYCACAHWYCLPMPSALTSENFLIGSE